MEPLKLNVFIATFSYGGNGGFKSQHPDVGDWITNTILKAKEDPRIASIMKHDFSDTPITMTRNRAVLEARKHGADVLIMIDSDQAPDLGYPGAEPFFDSSFDFLYKHYHKGPVIIGAPYVGPPPDECIYVFRWRNHMSDNPDDVDNQLDKYTREEAAEMYGIHECAALPTGLIMAHMDVFNLTEPQDASEPSWFYYEWEDKYQAGKASTEDVTATRDMSLAGYQQLGYNPVFCNWSSWAGHWKPKCCGKPQLMGADAVSDKLKAAMNRLPSTKKRVELHEVG